MIVHNKAMQLLLVLSSDVQVHWQAYPTRRVAKVRVSSIKNGRIRCFLLIQLKLETRVFKLETLVLIMLKTFPVYNSV